MNKKTLRVAIAVGWLAILVVVAVYAMVMFFTEAFVYCGLRHENAVVLSFFALFVLITLVLVPFAIKWKGK